jgi:hypothetical protein
MRVERRTRHYYCCLCLDGGKDPSYKPLFLARNSSALAHFRSQHDQQSRSARSTVERGGSAAASPGPVEFVFQSAVDKFNKLLLIKWIAFCHIAFFQIENRYFRNLLTFFSSQLEKHLPSLNTLRDWVLTEYKA